MIAPGGRLPAGHDGARPPVSPLRSEGWGAPGTPGEGSPVARRSELAPGRGGWIAAALRAPLWVKLAGANVLIVVAALAAALLTPRDAERGLLLWILGSAVAGSLIANVALVSIALRPLGELEETAQQVWGGDLSARVPASPLVDRRIQRVGHAINALLDRLAADRERLRELTGRVITTADDERSFLARELHDSAAQSLAALLLELRVASGDSTDPALLERMERIRRIASDVLDEVRLLAQTVHPRVLDDLGLGPALLHLARESEKASETRVEVVAATETADLPRPVASVLFRVAQEAVGNAIRHGRATVVQLNADVARGVAQLEVADDGAGFHLEEAVQRRPGMGLYTIQERVALLGGTLGIDTAPGRGTRLVATVPVGTHVSKLDVADRTTSATT